MINYNEINPVLHTESLFIISEYTDVIKLRWSLQMALTKHTLYHKQVWIYNINRKYTMYSGWQHAGCQNLLQFKSCQ